MLISVSDRHPRFQSTCGSSCVSSRSNMLNICSTSKVEFRAHDRSDLPSLFKRLSHAVTQACSCTVSQCMHLHNRSSEISLPANNCTVSILRFFSRWAVKGIGLGDL